MVSMWIEIATATFTGAGVAVAWIQLSGIKKSMDMSGLMAVLEIETQMNERKVYFDESCTKLRIAKHENQSEDALQILCDAVACAKENYFNAMDRLSFCVLKGYLSDKDWRAEFRPSLQKAIATYPNDFNEASLFRNIKKLNGKWQDE